VGKVHDYNGLLPIDPRAAVPAAAFGAASTLAWAVRGRSAQVFGKSYWRGPAGAANVALTFDDGPSEGTRRILEILAGHGVPATFFQCGANVERLPSIAREVAAAGHEIGNHSYSHPMLCFRGRRFLAEELRRGQDAIGRHTGVTPAWFRAPFGVRWFGLGAAQRAIGVTGVMWTVIGYDWNRTADEVTTRIAGRVSNGAILCLHDGRELRANPDISTTVEAVRRLAPLLLDRGYTFQTVSRLLCPMTSSNESSK
jgi:peptidoglycan/xylan/chitin deacetylase (PgdA/CDA1 family)